MLSALCALLVITAIPPTATGAVTTRFAGIFGDRMILQRNAPLRVWGRASPGADVTIALDDTRKTARSDGTGAWQVEFSALPAGGPHRLTLSDASGTVQSIGDILVGDLWLCSGQSNMEFPMARATAAFPEPAEPNRRMRLVTIRHDNSPVPRQEFSPGPEWSIADAKSVRDFSAVCYFFAREMQKSLEVPLGLIHASWGGSRIEPWMSARALRSVGGFAPQLDLLEAYVDDKRAAMQRFGSNWEDWWRKLSSQRDVPWADAAATTDWKAAPETMQDWNTYGDPELAGHTGMVWFRNSFELNAEQAATDAVITLGGIDEVDVTWINGIFVGTQFGWGTGRTYEVPRNLLKVGRNNVTLNVLNTWGTGGMLGPREEVGLRLGDGRRVSLAGGWRYRVVPDGTDFPPRAPWESIGGLTGLFNAMIAPLEGLRMAGALWYQGESNTGDAGSYEKLLDALIADWRRRSGGSLPFLIVQLPNFGTPATGPVESGWAGIRDAQRRVARGDPDTGLVVTIDTGDDRDLHPPNKAIVGQRAATVAGALLFGGHGLIDGIQPARAVQGSGDVVVEFDADAGGLIVIGDDRPVAFELCPSPPSACVYADARLDDNRVFLSTDAVPQPARVRYCWADAPVCNLYDNSQLPVGSFDIPVTRR